MRFPPPIEGLRLSARAGMVWMSALASALRPGRRISSLYDDAVDILSRAGVQGNAREYLSVSVTEVVEGGGGTDQGLLPGDLVTLQGGLTLAGYSAKLGMTVGVGPLSARRRGLLETTRAAVMRAALAVRPGATVREVSRIISQTVRDGHCRVCSDATWGHALRQSSRHDPLIVPPVEYPSLAQVERLGLGLSLTDIWARDFFPGDVVYLSVAATAGSGEASPNSEDGSLITTDGAPAALFAMAVVVTENGPRLLAEL